MTMAEEEDEEEVLLEGGPFHRYIMENTVLQSSLFSKEDKQNINYITMSPFSFARMEICAETRELLDTLLNSSLMLDDDAQWVYLLSERTETRYNRLNLKTLVCCSGLLLTGCATLLFRSCSEIWLSFFAGSTLLIIYFGRSLMSHRVLNNNVRLLCNNINAVYSNLKKHFNFLNQLVAYLTTKEILYNIQHVAKRREKYKWTKEAVSLVSSELMLFLFDSVNSCKILTIELVELLSDKPENISILAFSTDAQLGLDEIMKQCENAELTVSVLDKLRHVYIILQSQFLRLLAYYSCKINSCSQRNQVIQILKKYNEVLSKFTSKKLSSFDVVDMEMKYFKRSASALAKRSALENKNSMLVQVENIKLYLHSVLDEVALIEDLLVSSSEVPEENLDIDIDIGLGVETISREVKEIISATRQVKKLLNKEKESATGVKPELTIHKEESDDKRKTLVEVGKSDFSIKSVDEVFLRVPDEQYEEYPEDNSSDLVMEPDSRVHDVYHKVMSEMEPLLKCKREEFQKRELIAAGELNAKLEDFIDSLDKEDPSRTVLKKTVREFSESVSVPVPQTYDLNAHRAIALKAVNKSLEWHLKSTDESSYEG